MSSSKRKTFTTTTTTTINTKGAKKQRLDFPQSQSPLHSLSPIANGSKKSHGSPSQSKALGVTPTNTRVTSSTSQSNDSNNQLPISSHRKALLEASLYDTYKFLDADHSVSASKFSARRLPEIKSLWRSFVRSKASTDESLQAFNNKKDVSNNFYKSNGKKISSRHLRRRTTSHHRRKRHRNTTCKKKQIDESISDQKGCDLSNKGSRLYRRKKRLLKEQHSSWHLSSQFPSSPDNGDIKRPSAISTSKHNDKNWLETHIWHSKRFHMSHPLSIYDNWCVPLIHTNRGSLAALRLSQTKCTLQDATWTIGGKMITVQHTISQMDCSTSSNNRNETQDGSLHSFPSDTKYVEVDNLRESRDTDGESKDDDYSDDSESKYFSNRLLSLVEKLCPNSIQCSSSSIHHPIIWGGHQIVEGIVHNIHDTFPNGAIGPARFIFGRKQSSQHQDHVDDCADPSRKQQPTQFESDLQTEISITHYVHVVTHPSIMSDVCRQINGLISTNSDMVMDIDVNQDEKGNMDILNESNELSTSIRGGFGLLQIRGADATNAIAQSLNLEFETTTVDNGLSSNWNVISENGNVTSHTILDHGTIITVSLKSTLSYLQRRQKEKNYHPSLTKYTQNQTQTLNGEQGMDHAISSSIVLEEANSLLLISHCPNNLSNEKTRACNIAISGWDILCPASMTREIFLELIIQGGACPIGLIESSSLQLEADPPTPIWPRDYPDTMVGNKYWSEELSKHCDTTTEINEWKLVKFCLENSLNASGRVKTELKGLLTRYDSNRDRITIQQQSSESDLGEPTLSSKTIYESRYMVSIWSKLIHESSLKSNIVTNNSVIVVRGNFTRPFDQAINGWCSQNLLQTQEENTESRISSDDSKSRALVRGRRRPRRKQRSSSSKTVPHLSNIEADAHEKVCITLLQSLSMPALLRCHLIVDGKGSLQSGMFIKQLNSRGQVRSNHSSSISPATNVNVSRSIASTMPDCAVLGFVIASSFSTSRGKYHGVGFIASRQLLIILARVRDKNLTEDEAPGTFSMTTSHSGKIVISLKVHCGYPFSVKLQTALLSILP